MTKQPSELAKSNCERICKIEKKLNAILGLALYISGTLSVQIGEKILPLISAFLK